MHAGLCTKWRTDAHGGQKKVLNPLELGLHIVVSYHVHAGIEPGFSRRAANALIHLSSLNQQTLILVKNYFFVGSSQLKDS